MSVLKFQRLQAQLGQHMNEENVTKIAIAVSNTNISDKEKEQVLEHLLKQYK